jgi:hypothetical protein
VRIFHTDEHDDTVCKAQELPCISISINEYQKTYQSRDEKPIIHLQFHSIFTPSPKPCSDGQDSEQRKEGGKADWRREWFPIGHLCPQGLERTFEGFLE